MKKLIYSILISFICAHNVQAQDCIDAIVGAAGSYKYQDGANCKVRLCVSVSGSPRPKQIQFELTSPAMSAVAMCSGGDIHPTPYDCGNGAAAFADGTYCYTFTIAGTCPATVDGTVRGYTNASGGTGGLCTTIPYSTIALPVKLTSFSSKSNNEGIKLTWQTAEEVNSDFFEVQRSKDALNFEALGLVKSAGNSSDINDYVFVDNNPAAGYNYYRLQMVDKDKSSLYSSIISAKYLPKGDIVVSPNPASSRAIFVMTKGFSIEDIQLFSIEGREQSIQVKSKADEEKIEIIPTKALTTGVYFLNLNTALGIQKHKIIIE